MAEALAHEKAVIMDAFARPSARAGMGAFLESRASRRE